ncbi:LURP-one-related/scramblase family protein [Planomonospora corallina]|uniref:LURP-one-related/scramblase family protein n=1 Tax=Planomonospora corallina TaxID=1806052 RepID=A0ABV8I3W8_9ACTN
MFGRHDGSPAPLTTDYLVQRRPAAFSGDFWIGNGLGQPVFHVAGTLLRLRKDFTIEDATGQELLRARSRVLRVRETMVIEREGRTVATLHENLVGLRSQMSVELEEGGQLRLQGDVAEHDYTISHGGAAVAQVSGRRVHAHDAYGVSIAQGHDDVLLLAVAVCADALTPQSSDRDEG